MPIAPTWTFLNKYHPTVWVCFEKGSENMVLMLLLQIGAMDFTVQNTGVTSALKHYERTDRFMEEGKSFVQNSWIIYAVLSHSCICLNLRAFKYLFSFLQKHCLRTLFNICHGWWSGVYFSNYWYWCDTPFEFFQGVKFLKLKSTLIVWAMYTANKLNRIPQILQ